MRRSNREVNIFNMSLLDILCGALGAFCFMMLSLLPYYRPGKVEVSKEQKEMLDELQKIKDLSERLKSASTAEDLTELVEQLKKQIAALENRIKQLQGQVNSLYAENEDLKKRLAKLDQENQQLRARNQQLEQENQQLRARKQQLEQENQRLLAEKEQLQKDKQQLEQEKRKLENRLQQKTPWTVTVVSSDPRVTLDCSLHEQVIAADDEHKTRQADFDPKLSVQPITWNGDARVETPGVVTRVNADRALGSVSRFYVKADPGFGRSFMGNLTVKVEGYRLAPVAVPPIVLPQGKNWMLSGTFRVEAPDRITFTEATQSEREAEWARLEKRPEQKTVQPSPTPGPDSRFTDATMGPGFEKRKREYETRTAGNPPPPVREAMLQLWKAEAQSERERQYVDALIANVTGAQPPKTAGDDSRRVAAAARRKFENTKAVNEATTQGAKLAILRKWLAEAEGAEERDYVSSFMKRVMGAAGQNPAPTPEQKPQSPLMRGIEELNKAPQNPQ